MVTNIAGECRDIKEEESAGRGTRTLESRRTSASASRSVTTCMISRLTPFRAYSDLPSLGTPALMICEPVLQFMPLSVR
jgi:hypothetical protein